MPEAVPAIDSGDTAWMIVATALVLLMTLPGLALLYAGMVRVKNTLSYSLAFTTPGLVVGGLDKAFLSGITAQSTTGTIPESVFATFQMTFAIITPALTVGAFAERMKFGALLAFVALWFTLVYVPLAHMVWSGPGALMWDWGVLDFAGGTVVHVNAGIAGLTAALVIGRRHGYPDAALPPHSVPFALIGAALLWVGWFGFNAGSALAANGTAGMAVLVTQVATAAAALAWMGLEWTVHGKPSALGVATGAIAGLVAITPASGTAGPAGALLIGGAAGACCFFSATRLKRRFGYDDSLDVFGVHAVGGIVGALLTGVAAGSLGGSGLPEGMTIGAQVWIQAKSVLLTAAWSGAGTFAIMRLLDSTLGVRVTREQEVEGLDLALHDERAYNH
jgi:ammonium transporter, Amt family